MDFTLWLCLLFPFVVLFAAVMRFIKRKNELDPPWVGLMACLVIGISVLALRGIDDPLPTWYVPVTEAMVVASASMFLLANTLAKRSASR